MGVGGGGGFWQALSAGGGCGPAMGEQGAIRGCLWADTLSEISQYGSIHSRISRFSVIFSDKPKNKNYAVSRKVHI